MSTGRSARSGARTAATKRTGGTSASRRSRSSSSKKKRPKTQLTPEVMAAIEMTVAKIGDRIQFLDDLRISNRERALAAEFKLAKVRELSRSLDGVTHATPALS